ncbi:MAG: PP2C family protein-serine/threonine phosphatase [Treponema sp.]
MGLIVFVWFFAIILFVASIYCLVIKNSFALALLRCSTTAFLAIFSMAILLHMLYSVYDINTFIFTKVYIALLVLCSAFMLQFAFDFPLFEKPKKKDLFFNIVYHLIGLAFIVSFVGEFYWNALYGFRIASMPIMGFPSIRILIFLFMFVTPILMAVIFLHKIFSLQNLIFRQQSFLMFISVLFVLGYWLFVYKLFDVFSWAIIIQPLGYGIFVVLTLRACSLNMTFDRKQLFFGLLRFLVFNAVPAVIVGLLSAYILISIRSFYVQILLLIITASISLAVAILLFYRFRRLLGDTREYKELLFNALQNIDYTLGGKETAKDFSEIIKKYIGTSSIDIMVVNDDNILETIYSKLDNDYSYDTRTRIFDFVLEENISILVKNNVLVDAQFQDYRNDFLSFFNKTLAEVIVFLREGNKGIGIVSLGRKSMHADYTIYDLNMLKETYSYFFLIVYYLKNIAKEDVAITVDREIEMSNQIIGSIQKNMDVIKNRNIEVANISYSAHQLGGDFIDFIKLTEDKYFFLIGDVSGKGLSASMSMVILKSTLRTFLVETHDFKELIVKVNNFIKTNLPRSTFFAGLFAIIDLATSTIYYVNCGIPLMSMFVDSYKNVIEIQGEGRVLGFVKNIAPYIKVRKITLNPNDVIFLTTDGLLDSINLCNVKFGSERVNRLLLSLKNKTAPVIVDTIYKNLTSFISAEIEDDVTMLVFKRNS